MDFTHLAPTDGGTGAGSMAFSLQCLSVFTFDWLNMATLSKHYKRPRYYDLGLKALRWVYICEGYKFAATRSGVVVIIMVLNFFNDQPKSDSSLPCSG